MGPKCANKTCPFTNTPQWPVWIVDTRQNGSMLILFTPNSDPTSKPEIETHLTRQLLLFNSDELASVSCSYLTKEAVSGVFCCCSPCASSLTCLHSQMHTFLLTSAFLCCFPDSSKPCGLSPPTSDITGALWIFSLFLTILCKSQYTSSV